MPTPVVIGEGRLFLTGGYNAGSAILQLKEEDGKLAAEAVKRFEPKAFDSPQQTPVLFDSHLYAVRADGRLACADVQGEVLWESGATHTFGLGPYMIADGLLFVLDDAARLTIAEATPAGFKPLAQAKLLDGGHDAWAPMSIAGGRLILRDLTRMVCLDVRKPGP